MAMLLYVLELWW